MSHSPLRLMNTFHNKRCLISGQGPIVEIAYNLGRHANPCDATGPVTDIAVVSDDKGRGNMIASHCDETIVKEEKTVCNFDLQVKIEDSNSSGATVR